MYSLTRLLARRAELVADLTAAQAEADAAYVAYVDDTGAADFADSCYYADRAYEARLALEGFDLGAAALVLALEA